VREMKNRNSRMREIAFHTLFCMVSMVSILLTMQKKYTLENDPLQAQITMREFQFFESIIEKKNSKIWVKLKFTAMPHTKISKAETSSSVYWRKAIS
jgi:hypothetical protein